MKKLNITLFTVSLAILFILNSCNKKNNPDPSTAPPKQNDQVGSAEADGAIQDVNDIINNKMGGGSNAKVAAYNLPCGVVTFDSTTTNNIKTYNIKYGDQTPCGFKYKSGTVSFTLKNGTTFKDVGAVFIITFTNYKVTSKLDNSTVTLNGTLSVTNVNGGYIYEAATTGATIVHKLRGTFNITYSNNATRSRSYYQKRTWASSSGWAGLSLTITGDSTITTPNNVIVSETGHTYEGNYYFQTEISTDFNWSNCGSTWAGPYVLKTGHAKLNVTVPNISNTYVDIEGGYYWDLNHLSTTPTFVQDCSSNAYKVNTVIGSINTTVYQPY